MASQSSFQKVVVVNLFVEAASWGVHCITYVWSIYALLHSKRFPERWAFWGVTTFSTLFWLIGTTDVSATLYLSLKELVIEDSTPPDVDVILESVSVIDNFLSPVAL
jgi:hypothetical protein